jgi:excisionase family DNA binding protein
MKDDWITTEDAASISGYHVDHVRRLIREGKVSARKWMRDWQVSRASLLDYISRMEEQGKKRGPRHDRTK